MSIKTLLIADINIDGNTQSRVRINQEVVADYARLIGDSVNLPPIIVFFDGVDYWIADGFHRLHATLSLGKKSNIICDVRKGTQRDAILYSLSANANHGLTLTSEDKRKAVGIMLADEEWAELSDRAISRHCGCSHTLVMQLRNPEAFKKASAAAKAAEQAEKATDSSEATGNIATPTPEAKPAATGNIATQAQQAAAENAEAAHGGDDDPIALLEASYAEVAELRALLSVAEADDKVSEVLKYKRIADVSARRQNELMDTVNAREKELQRMSNILRRIGRALDEDDTSKIAAMVEAMVRTSKVAA